MKILLLSLLLVFSASSAACGGGPAAAPSASGGGQAKPAPAAPTPVENLPKIVAFGDSLTAGYGLPLTQSYPSLLQKKLDADGFKYEVVNAGVSGDTSAAGLRRIDWTLDAGGIRILILELGANDFLRLQPVAETKKNLAQIIERSKARGGPPPSRTSAPPRRRR